MSAISSATSASFNQDQFLQLLVAQLQNQDPSSPVESKEFIAQLATFSQLQGIQSLNATFSESLKLQQLTQGTNLIGKTVDYNLPGGGEPHRQSRFRFGSRRQVFARHRDGENWTGPSDEHPLIHRI